MRSSLKVRLAALERRLSDDARQRCNSYHVALYDVDEQGNWTFTRWTEDLPCTCEDEPIKGYESWMWDVLDGHRQPRS